MYSRGIHRNPSTFGNYIFQGVPITLQTEATILLRPGYYKAKFSGVHLETWTGLTFPRLMSVRNHRLFASVQSTLAIFPRDSSHWMS